MASLINVIGEFAMAAARHDSSIVFGEEVREIELETSHELEGEATGSPFKPRVTWEGATFMDCMSSTVRVQSPLRPMSSPYPDQQIGEPTGSGM